MLSRFFFGSLHRIIVWRTLLVSAVPLIALGAAAILVSNNLSKARFTEQAHSIAAAAAIGLAEKSSLA